MLSDTLKTFLTIASNFLLCAWNELLQLLNEHPSQIQAIAGLLSALAAILILKAYCRQGKLLEEQTRISSIQTDMQSTLTRLQYMPYVVFHGTVMSNPDLLRRLITTPSIKNIGRGHALGIRTCAWLVDKSIGEKISFEILFNRGDLAPDQFAGAIGIEQVNEEGEYHSTPVTIIHYKDVFEQLWHTTVNIDPNTGEFSSQKTPIHWDSQRWEENVDVHEWCLFCNKY